MRIVVTGASGFVGRCVLAALARRQSDRIVAVDLQSIQVAGAENIKYIEGSISDRAVRMAALSEGCDVLIHLATVPGGGAEANPALAKEINLDASIALIGEVAARNKAKVVFASSIAVYGETATAINQDTPVRPKLLYGAHKAMMELWLSTMTRRGEVDAVSLRLPAVIARPRGPSSGMKSAFLSEIFHAALSNEQFIAPVSGDASLWLMSRKAAVRNILHAANIALSEIDGSGAITLPAIRCTLDDLAREIMSQKCSPNFAVAFDVDIALENGFGRLPLLDATTSKKQGFVDDVNLASLVSTVFDDLENEDLLK